MNPICRCLVLLLAFFFLASSPALSQKDDSRFEFYARGPYRDNVPRPQSILRFDVGEFHTNYALMERVIEKISQAANDRMRVFEIGETNEHRMMRLLAISSPANIARLDDIKANVARLSDPRTLSQEDARELVKQTPVVVWLNYTIHGNESASFEAMIQVVYQLAASTEPATMDILNNTLVLVNVCANPDGHERFVSWYNSVSIGNPDPLAGEHREPWSVYGRLNRYRFDLNRDNVVSSQTETRNMQRAFLDWHPQVFVDHHGQPSQFFFPPAALPINPNLPADSTARWLSAFGKANAAQFDQQHWDFYVREVFDLFYPGYWDSWPSLNGATGMTYETDGGGWKGLNWRRDDDTIVTLRSGIAKHFVAGMTTLETASRNRIDRLNDYYEFKRSAIEEGKTDQIRRFVILPGRDPMKCADLIDVLLRAGIEVSVAHAPFRSLTAHELGTSTNARLREFPSGVYVIDLAQPQKRLARALLEQNTNQDAAFVREQLARFQRNERRGNNAEKEDYGFYDITSWSLPLAFGVEAYWTDDGGAPRESTLIRDTTTARAGFFAPAARASVAYIVPVDSDGAMALAYRLQKEGFRLAFATRTLSAGGRDWARGTIVIRVSRNPDTLHEAITRIANETAVEVTAVNSGFNETGETGIGSENVIALKRPTIIVAADDPVSQTSYGSLWHTFNRMGVDFTPMTIANMKRAVLDRYNVIILPDGSADGYSTSFGKAGVETLRGWVERGGTLVCLKGAAVFAALKDVNLTSSRLVGSDDDEDKSGESDSEAKPKPSPEAKKVDATQGSTNRTKGKSDRTPPPAPQSEETNQTEKMEGVSPDLPPIASPSARAGVVPEAVPGAIMRATIDRTTYLTFGYESKELPVLLFSGYFFRPSREGTNAVVFAKEDAGPLRIAGFVWPGNTERLLRGTAYVIDEPTGSGHVVLYAEDPNFRAIFRSTTRLFMNSVIFSPAF